MIQKVLKVGTSAAVTIPKQSLEELGLRIGDQVIVDIDKAKGMVSIRRADKRPSGTTRVAKLTLDFIERYRSDIEALARK